MFVILSIILSGLIVGALGRLAVPGPNPMSIVKTIVIGVIGSIVGGLIGAALFGSDSALIIVLEVIAAAGIVYFLQRREATV